MPKPVLLSLILKVLHNKGFIFVRQKGSHARYSRTEIPEKHLTIKTTKKEIPYGTFRSILLQSGLDEKDFFPEKNNKI
ncbi:MAG: hypothetical protein US83_C0015G0016 [Candidatus Falkowbacteria bacterium GW2011_GWC2_38_22]|nr:MAG: hypothetical protein US73_C0013G0016 [Candidatus Falkowbacteria bacterium GW2011_GWF2_38_1205]KKQ60608.1 MAG: hypothetical protein US83_C0015G0016 [Candidatus Falkowbacteria bacterium GW2011_GWC2_38_22]KKQ62699.1 MAG: hypothetical protein US84_C0012G0016 [Candidatus Falkowbacteria bacterium GW2011_GWF1_38_22]KKQ64826.1 MAG: hypothetical protein US87_C0012G0016 [Candidatus Falkowbacteria bacterium GW2011_GWE2_38_254]KKQ72068.1 MAG: hypothetical protein US93_C0012G0016 [Candidatus Falkowb